MAYTPNNHIYYPDDYSLPADVPADMQRMAESIEANLDDINELIEKLKHSDTGRVFGVRRVVFDVNNAENTNPEWERILDNVGLVANATHDGTAVVNDFDTIAPWSNIRSGEYDTANHKFVRYIDDILFNFESTDYEIMTEIPELYIGRYTAVEDGVTYEYRFISATKQPGLIHSKPIIGGRYRAFNDSNNKLHSRSGVVPTTSKTLTNFRTYAHNNDAKCGISDVWFRFVLETLYLVEYAHYNSQTKLGLGSDSRKYLKNLVAGTDVNFVVVSASAGYWVGQTIRIGTSDGGTQRADVRHITNVEEYNEGGVTGYKLTFDGAAVTVAVDDYVCTMAQTTGQLNSLGMKSGCLVNDGYHSVIYRGFENCFADIYEFIDGINIKNGTAVYVCMDPSKYAVDKFDDGYELVGYSLVGSEGWAKNLGCDNTKPYVALPVSKGASNSTGTCDFTYQTSNNGNYIACVGGYFSNGLNGGLFCWVCRYDSSYSLWSLGARLLINP